MAIDATGSMTTALDKIRVCLEEAFLRMKNIMKSQNATNDF